MRTVSYKLNCVFKFCKGFLTFENVIGGRVLFPAQGRRQLFHVIVCLSVLHLCFSFI